VGGLGCGWAKLNVVFLCRQVRWQNTSFNFAKRWHFRPPFLSVYVCSVGRPTLAPNVLRLPVVGVWNSQLSIPTNVYLKIQNFILPRPRQLLVGAVIAS